MSDQATACVLILIAYQGNERWRWRLLSGGRQFSPRRAQPEQSDARQQQRVGLRLRNRRSPVNAQPVEKRYAQARNAKREEPPTKW
jgi:hypothetical protein